MINTFIYQTTISFIPRGSQPAATNNSTSKHFSTNTSKLQPAPNTNNIHQTSLLAIVLSKASDLRRNTSQARKCVLHPEAEGEASRSRRTKSEERRSAEKIRQHRKADRSNWQVTRESSPTTTIRGSPAIESAKPLALSSRTNCTGSAIPRLWENRGLAFASRHLEGYKRELFRRRIWRSCLEDRQWVVMFGYKGIWCIA
ncbi:hypothetical protein KM043_007855 [Ampulex compressa]|nr:hypothetical protein KM043_007855 [Ampulex compressa]